MNTASRTWSLPCRLMLIISILSKRCNMPRSVQSTSALLLIIITFSDDRASESFTTDFSNVERNHFRCLPRLYRKRSSTILSWWSRVLTRWPAWGKKRTHSSKLPFLLAWKFGFCMVTSAHKLSPKQRRFIPVFSKFYPPSLTILLNFLYSWLPFLFILREPSV